MAKKILLVGKMLYLMSDPLEKKGYSVVGRAETGDGGIRLARDSDMQKPHLAMIEYKLPDMDGLTVAEKIIQVRPSIAVVLCVNKDLADRREIEERARALGVRCILHTPYIMDDLFDAVEAALERSLFSKPAFRIFGGRNLKADVRVSRQAPSGAWLEREKRNPRNHILIADSAPFVQKMMSDTLGKAGYEIVGTARTEQECLQMIQEQCPDLVLLDYMEEKDNRLDFVRRIRQIDAVIHIVLRINREKYPDIEKMARLAIDAGTPAG